MAFSDLRTLIKAERELAKALANVVFIGESRFLTHEYYRKHILAVRRTVGGQSQRIRLVPPRALLVLMVLCARLNDISEHGFWDCFLKAIGLPNDQNSQATCRSRFREARSLLQHLHFPEGGYACVTPVLYHAVIPQTCIQEMALLLRKLDQEVGWDAIAEMEPQQLDFHLPNATSRAHASKPLHRFVSDAQSRRIAGQLVRDLCEAAYLHKKGEFLPEEIESLLRDYPIQQEIWREMLVTKESLPGAFSLYSLFMPPSWQWDIKSRELRIYIPKQRVVGLSAPVALAVKDLRVPITARFTGDAWEVEPTYISNALINWSATNRLKFGLVDEKGNWLRPWYIKPLSDRALFFRPNPTANMGMHVDSDRGLPPGDSLLLLRQGLRIRDANGDVIRTSRWFSPRGFEEYTALSVTLQPPVSILNDEDELLETISATQELRHSLQLNGDVFPEADDPSGIPVFIDQPPELTISLKRLEEMQGMGIQCRALSSVEGPKLTSLSIDKLMSDGIAQWSPQNLRIQVPLSKLLPKGMIGRFRIRLLYGLQSAGYEPAEFFVVPQTKLIPEQAELEKVLFTSESPPTLKINSPASSGLESVKGQIQSSDDGAYIISWSYQETEFKATLFFGKLSIPLKWRPHILRAGVSSTNGSPLWSAHAVVLQDTALTFSASLHVEALPLVNYEIDVNQEVKQRGQFESGGLAHFALAHFSELARGSRKNETSVTIRILTKDHDYHLPILKILKGHSGRNGEANGAQISRIPTGQSVIHPDYGFGSLEDFTEKRVDGASIKTARFFFQRYEHVQFFIPVARRIPLYLALRESSRTTGGTP